VEIPALCPPSTGKSWAYDSDIDNSSTIITNNFFIF